MPASSTSSTGRYRLGDLILDIHQRRVTRQGRPLKLGKLTFELLRVLVEAAPAVLTKDELTDLIWTRRAVNPETVAQRIKLLRDALTDDAHHPRYIEVVRGQGYRLIPDVEPLAADAPSPVWKRPPRLAAVGVLAGIAVVIGIYWSDPERLDTTEASRTTTEVDTSVDDPIQFLPNSIAVLPFENLSPDPDKAFFAAGIHQATINQLTKIRDLSVIGRTSVMQYAEAPPPIPEIARALKVEMVMEGSVRYANDRVLITAQLIDGRTGAHIWSEAFNRDPADIFEVQAAIAMNIANALEAEISLSEQERIVKRPTNSPAAYQLYLRARTTADKVGLQGSDVIAVANAYLDQAIELDPQFALAYVRKAELVPLVRRQSTRSYVEKALELDPDLGLAHAALATADATLLLEAEARKGYERALELSPNDPEILSIFALFNAFTERHEDAIRLGQRAVALDPNYAESHFLLGHVYLFAGNVDAAVDAFLRASILDPADAQLYLLLGRIEGGRGNQTEAAQYLQTAAQLIGSDAPTIVLVAHGYALAGLQEQAVEFVTRFRALTADSAFVPLFLHAVASLALGESDEALKFLTRLAEGEASSYGVAPMHVKFNVFSDPILDQPEFVAVRQRLGFTNL